MRFYLDSTFNIQPFICSSFHSCPRAVRSDSRWLQQQTWIGNKKYVHHCLLGILTETEYHRGYLHIFSSRFHYRIWLSRCWEFILLSMDPFICFQKYGKHVPDCPDRLINYSIVSYLSMSTKLQVLEIISEVDDWNCHIHCCWVPLHFQHLKWIHVLHCSILFHIIICFSANVQLNIWSLTIEKCRSAFNKHCPISHSHVFSSST